METNKFSWRDWLASNTEFDNLKNRLLDAPDEGFSAWARTTAGVVAFLFFLQFFTGFLLAFYYVPTAENAHTTVAFIEQAVSSGSWIRSLHYHSSILLPIALIAHLAQMIWRKAYLRNLTAWASALIFLALSLKAAATGYALPWDARAFNGVNVALSLAENTPLVGAWLKAWLQNGERITTLTVSRFYALHVFLAPALILLFIAARLFFFGKKNPQFDEQELNEWARAQFLRNAVAIGVVFLGLAFYAARNPAPLAPPAREAANFLSRPGPQFLWLFELQKYTHGSLAAILAFGFPALIIGALFLIPFFSNRFGKHRLAVSAIFALGVVAVGILTAMSVVHDARDERAREQLAKQRKDEMEFRAAGFKPQTISFSQEVNAAEQPNVETKKETISETKTENQGSLLQNVQTLAPPKIYQTTCAKCHGASGQGTKLYPELKGVTTREEFPLSDEDLLAIINDAKAFGLSAKMPVYKNKLSEDQKQEIIRWIKTLK